MVGLVVVAGGLTALALAATGSDGQGSSAEAGSGHDGLFVVECTHSHSAPDDPIVFPGEPGMSHLHDFFGNTTADAHSTIETLRGAGTTCATKQDAASYWAPALFEGDRKVEPISSDAYYRVAPGVDPADVEPFPEGLRVISGDADSLDPLDLDVVGFACGRRFNRVGAIPGCAEGSTVSLHVTFPDCWDGRSLDSPDHRSHMAHSDDDGCPSSHPQPVPQLEFVVHYPTVDPDETRFASGAAQTAHADFFNAWDPEKLADEVELCLRRDVVCGVASAEEPAEQGRGGLGM